MMLNKQADQSLLGVKLGKKCIGRGVSVADVANKLNVSRQTVYNWFVGLHSPNNAYVAEIEQLIKSTTRK